MKCRFFILILLATITRCCAQIKFEAGYFISNNGTKTNCLIKNVDWKYNPKEFIYKLTDDSKTLTGSIENVSEFGITSVSKYKRYFVNIDRSSRLVSNLDNNREPEFVREQLFLKTLVDGKAVLYLYEEADLERYFFSVNNTEPEQLVYKQFMVTETQAGENLAFKDQLKEKMQCSSLPSFDFDRLTYSKNDLKKLFVKYNICQDVTFVDFAKPQKRKGLALMIKAGLNYGSMKVENVAVNPPKMDMGSKAGFRAGIEAEFLLPFNKNKWAVVVDPSFQYFKSGDVVVLSNSAGKKTMNVDYKSVELPLGVRHYFYLNEGSAIFLNGFVIYDIPVSSRATAVMNNNIASKLEVKSKINMAFGAGYKYKKKISMEIRYGLDRDIFANYAAWNTGYTTLSVVAGYRL